MKLGHFPGSRDWSLAHFIKIFILKDLSDRVDPSVVGTGGQRGLARAHLSNAPAIPRRDLVSFSGRLRDRTDDDVRAAAGELPHRSEVSRARTEWAEWHGTANLRSSDAFSRNRIFRETRRAV